MLGRQVPSLFFDADDAAEFYRLVRAQGAEVLASESPTRRVRLASPSEAWSLFLAPAQGLDELVPGYVAAQRYWVLDPSEHPVVAWTVLPEKDGVLRAGRLYYVPRDLRDGELRERSAEFLRFAKDVRRVAEKLAPTTSLADGGRGRVGPSARERHERGELSLARI